MNLALQARHSPGARVSPIGEDGWRLEIPPGPPGAYRLAQLDDYAHLRRPDFPWSPPLSLTLQARASQAFPPGTWGFGFWNDPFSLTLGLGGATRRLPALPNTAWFFFASPPNYLTLDESLPSQGGLAATFQSPSLATPWLAVAVPLLPFMALPATSRWLRRTARRWIQQSAAAAGNQTGEPGFPLTEWHDYTLEWRVTELNFSVDGRPVLDTTVSPEPPLGLVIWIDNQFAALPPGGGLAFGTLENPTSAWIEVRKVRVA